jgi:HEAT repeat protein
LKLASVWALVQIDPTNDDYVKLAVPQLISALDNDRPRIRTEAARTLAQLGPKSKSAVTALQKKLADEDPDVRRESLAALAEIGTDSSAAVPDIVKLAGKDGAEFRPLACYALGRIGPAAKSAVPMLNRLVGSTNSHEQAVAAWALVNIAPDSESIQKAIPLLAATLMHSQNPRARLEAAKTLGKIGSGPTIAAQAIKEGVNDPDENVRKAAQASSEKLK